MKTTPISSSSPFNKTPQNILIRRRNVTQLVVCDENFPDPEKLYILKYFPKYYNTLVSAEEYSNTLFSKVKRIKKLKRFIGYLRKDPQKPLWRNLFMHNRKEIEEIPVIFPYGQSLETYMLKFFLNLKRVPITALKITSLSDAVSLFQYTKNMRNLKSLQLFLTDENFAWDTWVIEKLNKMTRLLSSLEILTLEAKTQTNDLASLFHQNKNFLSHLTGLRLDVKFESVFFTIPEVCKNLKTLSINFKFYVYSRASDFTPFLTGIQSLPHLKSFEWTWPRYIQDFWRYFTPQSSLRSLKIRVDASDLIREGLFHDPVSHWQEIKELDFLEFSHSLFNDDDNITVMKQFITSVLCKINKLRSFKCSSFVDFSEENSLEYRPFFVDQVPHLYESLEDFEYSLAARPNSCIPKFDLKIMKPFRNLKKIELKGDGALYENIHEAVNLLESQRGSPTFELELSGPSSLLSSERLKEILMKIQKMERRKSSLKMKIGFAFKPVPTVDFLDELCNAIQSVETIEGLITCLKFYAFEDFLVLPYEEFKEVLSKYHGVRNIKVSVRSDFAGLELIRIDGQKERLVCYDFS